MQAHEHPHQHSEEAPAPAAKAATCATYATPAVGEAPEEDTELQQCGECGRSFNATALARHAKVCSKLRQQRKPLDMASQRLQGAHIQAITSCLGRFPTAPGFAIRLLA